MIDSIIIYFKNLPHVLNYSLKHVKNLWKWFTVSFIVGLVLIFAIEIFFKVTNATEMIQGVWLYRLLTLLGFGYIVLSLFLCYKIYAKDYMITKSFKISPVTPIVVTTIVGGILLFVLMTIIAIWKPINFESSLLATIYFMLVTIVLNCLLSVLFGLVKILNHKADIYLYIFCVIEFILVPIIYVPKTHLTMIGHVLMLNPFYYVTNGLAQSVLFGRISLANIPYHLYILCFILILCLINFALSRFVSHAKYRNKNKKAPSTLQSNHFSSNANHIKDSDNSEIDKNNN